MQEITRLSLFVKTCEGLISEEINQWESIQSKEVVDSVQMPVYKELEG